MNRLLSVLASGCLLISSGFAQSIWLQEDFARNRLGPHWPAESREWSLTGSSLQCETRDYDQLFGSSFYALGTTPYSFEVTMRGARAGVYFHLDDTTTKAFSHMVRFDDQSILTGYFNGAGEYRATNTFESPVPPTEWLTLRLDIDPVKGRYSVFVNGTLLGIDSVMMYRSGFLGLQASAGISEFRSVRVISSRRQVPLAKNKRGDEIRFQHVRFVQTEGNNVVIYNPETRGYQTLDSEGRLRGEKREEKLPTLRPEARIGNRTFSISGSRIVVRDSGEDLVDSLTERLSAPTSLIAGVARGEPVLYVTDPGVNSVLMYNPQGKFLKAFDAASIGRFRGPLSLDHYGDDMLVVADLDRLVFVPVTLDDSHPTVSMISPTEAEVRWPRVMDVDPKMDFFKEAAVTPSISPDGKENIVRVRGLRPLSRYSYYLSPVLRTIPGSASYSRLHRFSTPPAQPAMMAVTRLPLMYMVYRTISYRDKYPEARFPRIPDGRTLSNEEIAYLKKATEFNRGFYFRNSSCRLVLDFDFAVVEDTLWLHDVGDQDPYWLGPNERVTKDFEAAAARFGRKPEEYVGLLCPYAWVNYPPRGTSSKQLPAADTIRIRQAYGGGTYGVPAPWRYGKTAGYTGNPFQDTFSRQDWLITHEFHHQIDALMEASGFPEYYHCDTPWKMPGRFGEDFDFNAHIMRLAPAEAWLDLAFGSLEQTKDSDHDGVPDDDPSLPFDERRLNGNPELRDSDDDGLDDLHEILAGTSHGTELDNPDSDDDDLSDGSDPEPLYVFNGTIEQGEASTYAGSIQENDIVADVFLGWDENYFYVRYEADRPANILIQIDADADGWFHGFDNIQTRILANEDSLTIANFYLRDCSSWTQSPRDRRDILKLSDLLVEVQKQGLEVTGRTVRIRGRGILSQSRLHMDTYVLTAKIPANASYGLDLRQGKKIGVRIGLQTTTDLWVWHELFERNLMMELELR